MGCTASETLPIELPPEISWLALVPDGQPWARLVARDSPRALAVAQESGAGLHVYGYRAGLLDPFDVRDGMSLVVLEDCGPALPEASLHLRREANSHELVPADTAGPGVGLLVPSCAAPRIDFDVASRYGGQGFCTGLEAVTPIDSCHVEVRFVPTCALDDLVTPLRTDGTWCLGQSVVGDCRPVTPLARATFAAACTNTAGTTTHVDFFDPPSEPWLTITSTASLLFGDPLHVERSANREDRFFGLLTDMVAREDRVLAVKRSFDDARCTNLESPTRLYRLDPDSLAVVRTTTTPPCLVRMVSDAGGTGFLGVFHQDGTRLGRFSADGTLISSVQVPSVGDLDNRLDVATPTEILTTTGAARWVGVVFYQDLSREARHVFVAIHDLETLRWARTIQILDNGPFHMTFAAGLSRDGRFAMTDDQTNAMVLLDPESGAVESVPINDGEASVVYSALSPLPVSTPNDDRWVILKSRGLSQLATADVIARRPDRIVDQIAYPVASGVYPFALAEIPGTPAFLVAVGHRERWRPEDEPEVRAELAILDPAEGSFRPRPIVIGSGIPTRVLFDARGRVLVLLPWTATIIRAEVRP